MGGIKKNIIVFFYLVAVFGLGISSLFIGRRVADRQREITPQEAEAAREECVECCWQEWGTYDICCDNPPCPEPCMKEGCKQCKLQNPDNCDSNANIWPSDCWVPACEPPPPPPTATPTPIPTSTPIPTPTPLPGCWGNCNKDTECSQAPIALVCRPIQGASHCVNPACPSQETCQCPALICKDLTSDKEVSSLKKEDNIKLTCEGSSGVDQPLNHVKFRAQIDGGSWLDLGTGSGPGFAVDYTIPQTGNYQIECRVCTSTDDSVCTGWGQTGVASP